MLAEFACGYWKAPAYEGVEKHQSKYLHVAIGKHQHMRVIEKHQSKYVHLLYGHTLSTNPHPGGWGHKLARLQGEQAGQASRQQARRGGEARLAARRGETVSRVHRPGGKRQGREARRQPSQPVVATGEARKARQGRPCSEVAGDTRQAT